MMPIVEDKQIAPPTPLLRPAPHLVLQYPVVITAGSPCLCSSVCRSD